MTIPSKAKGDGMTQWGTGFPGNELPTDNTEGGDIPADVMKSAMRIKAECNVDFGGGIGGGAIIRMIADAIMEERERCAKVAETRKSEWKECEAKRDAAGWSTMFQSERAMEAGYVADAIRKGGAA